MGTEILFIFLLFFFQLPQGNGFHSDPKGFRLSHKSETARRLIELKGGSTPVVWVVQLSDLHFSIHHPDRAVDFKDLVGPALSVIKPSLVLITGDLTDGKSKDMLIMKQDKQEWVEYQNTMADIVKRSGLDKSIFYDLRGNHDKFGVPSVGDSYDFFSNYSINSQLGRHGDVNSVTLETRERRHVFVGVDTTMAVGLKGPTNLFGHPSDKLLAELDVELSQWDTEATKPVIKIPFGHFPISFSASSESGNSLKEVFLKHSVSAYLCGHLHSSFGNNLKRFHRSDNHLVQLNMQGFSSVVEQNCSNGPSSIKEFWEWEMGDWRKNRKMRILAIDKGHVSFLDLDLKSRARKTIIVPTFPLDSRTMASNSLLREYECGFIDQSSYSAIRALVFSSSPIVSVIARVYDSSPGYLVTVLEESMRNNDNVAGGVLFYAPWNFRAFEDPSPHRYLLQLEAMDIRGRSTITELRPFSINGFMSKFSWTWKETMVMGCQWDAIYYPAFWISIGFSLLILITITALPYLLKKQNNFLAHRTGVLKAGRVIAELNRFQMLWFGFMCYVVYLLLLPWCSGEVFTGSGERLYLTYKGWVMKSQGEEAGGKIKFIGSPDVMVVIIPHILYVVLPSIIVSMGLAVDRGIGNLHYLLALGKKEDDCAVSNKCFKIGSHFGNRWIRKVLMVINLAILWKHFKNGRAISRAYEMNLLLHFPVYSFGIPLLLGYAFYRTRKM